MILGFLVTLVLDIPVKLIVKGDANISSFITSTVATLAIMIFIFLNDGYQHKIYEPKKITVSLLIILVVMEAFIGTVKVSSFMTGPTIWLTNYIYHTDFQTQDISTYLSNMLLFAAAFVFVYSPIIYIFEHIGVKNRKQATADFLKEQKEHPQIDVKH